MLLPFYSELVDTGVVQSKEGKLQEISLSIYRGATLALDSLEKLGLNAQVHVKDVSTTDKAGVAVNTEPLKHAQLIIGPLQRNLIEAIAAQCAGNGTHVLCPVPQNNKVLLSKPAVSKIIGSEAAQITALAQHVRKHHSNHNIIVLNTGFAEDLKNHQLFTEVLNGTTIKGEPVPFSDHKTSGKSVSGLSSLLSLSRENVIVALTSNDVLLADMVTKLSLLNENKYRLHLIGLESWKDFKFLDAEQRNRFDVHLPAYVHSDLSDPLTLEWYRSFREHYNTEPDEYALSAFDAMMFYGLGLKEFGSNFESHFSDIRYQPRSLRFNMNKTGLESGFDNQGCFVLRYSNYLLVNADEQDK
jgi:ABC-type branched-subunit amino acid transport system substrate-binding protein